MADHALVEWTLDTIAAGYTDGNVATSEPVLVDDEDGTTYEIDNGGLSEVAQRFSPDPHNVNIVTVDPNPDRQQEPVGTEYDFRIEDAVGLTVEGIDTSEGGEIASPSEFRTLQREVRQTIRAERTSYPTAGGMTYHTVVPGTVQRPPEAKNAAHYYAVTLDVAFRGFEDLP
jgi:hypothetical protein